MAQTIQQLIDLIRASGASRDSKSIDDAVKAFDDATCIAFGQDFGERASGVAGLTCREVIVALGTAMKNFRASYAQQDALDRAIAIIERELT